MKFIHTADWHLGKLVHGVYMTEDQEYVLQKLIDLIKAEEPDALVIAGDLYDRSVPPTEAVKLLNDTLYTINVELGVPIIAISGNHDSGERLSFGSSWYRHSKLYMKGKWERGSQAINIQGVRFHLVPFTEPGPIRELYEMPSITSHHEAMKVIVDDIKSTIDQSVPNVLVGHAFVLGGKTTDSERTLSVGGSGCVGSELFEHFDYTALGHLHSPDAISHDSIHYAGSLMKYSFSEARQRKVVKIVEIMEKKVSVKERILEPKRDMRELEGYLSELMSVEFYQNQKLDDYLKVILLDEGGLIDPMNQLKQLYPNVLHLERKSAIRDRSLTGGSTDIHSRKKEGIDLFKRFYEDMTTTDWSSDKHEKVAAIINEVKAGRA
ncbi:exonuclease SbcCD subunit D [Jeotgalibacillus campisalis]|uniref:Nuclease SbcCD subunit D n=1 Tax=Jeotgalibacillus campisalis TaxID=220754 RepID=A0A0C2S1A0_9BACL|nr:exonuclease SbcCD subunit D [Jeotgalibacillus campisalis]KIL47829.1 nuclease SbcCD subunit D [Jeotgalibacillus campisalis]